MRHEIARLADGDARGFVDRKELEEFKRVRAHIENTVVPHPGDPANHYKICLTTMPIKPDDVEFVEV